MAMMIYAVLIAVLIWAAIVSAKDEKKTTQRTDAMQHTLNAYLKTMKVGKNHVR